MTLCLVRYLHYVINCLVCQAPQAVLSYAINFPDKHFLQNYFAAFILRLLIHIVFCLVTLFECKTYSKRRICCFGNDKNFHTQIHDIFHCSYHDVLFCLKIVIVFIYLFDKFKQVVEKSMNSWCILLGYPIIGFPKFEILKAGPTVRMAFVLGF